MHKCMIKFAPPQSSKHDTGVKARNQTEEATKRKTGRIAAAEENLPARGKTSAAFNVSNLCTRFRLVRPDLTRMTGYSLRSVDKWAAGENPGAATQRRLKEVGRLFEGLSEIMEPEYVGQWLKTPNDAFDGSTPLQVIERGETDRIWRMIFIVETGEPL